MDLIDLIFLPCNKHGQLAREISTYHSGILISNVALTVKMTEFQFSMDRRKIIHCLADFVVRFDQDHKYLLRIRCILSWTPIHLIRKEVFTLHFQRQPPLLQVSRIENFLRRLEAIILLLSSRDTNIDEIVLVNHMFPRALYNANLLPEKIKAT